MSRPRDTAGRFLPAGRVRAPEKSAALSEGGRRFSGLVVPGYTSQFGESRLDDPAEQVKHNRHWVYAAVRAIANAVSSAPLAARPSRARCQIPGTMQSPRLPDFRLPHRVTPDAVRLTQRGNEHSPHLSRTGAEQCARATSS